MSLHGGHPGLGYDTRDDCAAWAVEEGIPLSALSQAAAWTSGSGAEEIQDVYLRERVFLAWT